MNWTIDIWLAIHRHWRELNERNKKCAGHLFLHVMPCHIFETINTCSMTNVNSNSEYQHKPKRIGRKSIRTKWIWNDFHLDEEFLTIFFFSFFFWSNAAHENEQRKKHEIWKILLCSPLDERLLSILEKVALEWIWTSLFTRHSTYPIDWTSLFIR